MTIVSFIEKLHKYYFINILRFAVNLKRRIDLQHMDSLYMNIILLVEGVIMILPDLPLDTISRITNYIIERDWRRDLIHYSMLLHMDPFFNKFTSTWALQALILHCKRITIKIKNFYTLHYLNSIYGIISEWSVSCLACVYYFQNLTTNYFGDISLL